MEIVEGGLLSANCFKFNNPSKNANNKLNIAIKNKESITLAFL